MNRLLFLLVTAVILFPVVSGCGQDENSARFVVLGDIHLTEGHPGFFTQRIGEFNSGKFDFLIILGDMIPGYNHPRVTKRTLEQWAFFDSAVSELDIPWYEVPGNHDVWDRESERIYRKRFGRLWYSFERGGILFIILSSEEPGCREPMSEKQKNWFINTLESGGEGRPVIVCVHQPMWRYGAFWNTEIHPFLKRHSAVAVFAGHEHRYERTEKDGVLYIISGGGGAENLQGTPALGGFHHYCDVRLENGSLSYAVIGRHGKKDPLCVDPDTVRKARVLMRSLVPAVRLGKGQSGTGIKAERTVVNPFNTQVEAQIQVCSHAGSPVSVRPSVQNISIAPKGTQTISYTVFLAKSGFRTFLAKYRPWIEITGGAGKTLLWDGAQARTGIDVYPFEKARQVFRQGTSLPPIEYGPKVEKTFTFSFANPLNTKIDVVVRVVRTGKGWRTDSREIKLGPFMKRATAKINAAFEGTAEQFVCPPVLECSVWLCGEKGREQIYARRFSLPVDMADYFSMHRRMIQARRITRASRKGDAERVLPSITASGMLYNSGFGSPSYRTGLGCAWTDKGLYVRVECETGSLQPVITHTERDTNVFLDDAVEVYVQSRKSLFRFSVNRSGVLRDEKNGNKEWNSSVNAETREGDGVWTALLNIPWKDIDIQSPEPGMTIGFNLLRSEPRTEHVVSLFSPVFGRFDTYKYYGRLVLQPAQPHDDWSAGVVEE